MLNYVKPNHTIHFSLQLQPNLNLLGLMPQTPTHVDLNTMKVSRLLW